jgi:hypothetical protein
MRSPCAREEGQGGSTSTLLAGRDDDAVDNLADGGGLKGVIGCESARGPDADRQVTLFMQFALEGSRSGAYSHRRVRFA